MIESLEQRRLLSVTSINYDYSTTQHKVVATLDNPHFGTPQFWNDSLDLRNLFTGTQVTPITQTVSGDQSGTSVAYTFPQAAGAFVISGVLEDGN
jgi:hypothetical protein